MMWKSHPWKLEIKGLGEKWEACWRFGETENWTESSWHLHHSVLAVHQQIRLLSYHFSGTFVNNPYPFFPIFMLTASCPHLLHHLLSPYAYPLQYPFLHHFYGFNIIISPYLNCYPTSLIKSRHPAHSSIEETIPICMTFLKDTEMFGAPRAWLATCDGIQRGYFVLIYWTFGWSWTWRSSIINPIQFRRRRIPGNHQVWWHPCGFVSYCGW